MHWEVSFKRFLSSVGRSGPSWRILPPLLFLKKPGCASTGAPGTAPAQNSNLAKSAPQRDGAGRGQCCLRRVRKLIDAHVVSRWLATALGVVLQPSLVSSDALLVERGREGARGMERGCLVNCGQHDWDIDGQTGKMYLTYHSRVIKIEHARLGKVTGGAALDADGGSAGRGCARGRQPEKRGHWAQVIIE